MGPGQPGDGDHAPGGDATDSESLAVGSRAALPESYPTLQANEGFLRLQDQIEGNENRIATARRDYNRAATDHNARIRTLVQERNVFRAKAAA